MSLADSEIEEQLRALTEHVQQLQADNDRLRATEGASISASTTEVARGSNISDIHNNVFECYVYMPRERKCPKFLGKYSTVLTVEDWVEEVCRSLESHHIFPAEPLLFIYDHLQGKAKRELKFCSLSDRNDP